MRLEPGGIPRENVLGRPEQGLTGLSKPYIVPLSENDPLCGGRGFCGHGGPQGADYSELGSVLKGILCVNAMPSENDMGCSGV